MNTILASQNESPADQPAKEATGEIAAEMFEIFELEDRMTPMEVACACSTTCNCTTTSCMAWNF